MLAKHHLDLTAGPGHYLEVRLNINAGTEEIALLIAMSVASRLSGFASSTGIWFS